MILLVIPGVALAIVSIAAFAGGLVWWLDLLANFRPQYVVGLALFGLAIVMTRFRKIGYAVLAVGALNLAVVLPLYLGSPAQASPDQPNLTVMSFNLLSSNESYSEVLEYIESVDPDLVLLHEASRPWEVAVESSDLDYDEVIRPRSDNLIFGTLVLVRGLDIEAVSYGFDLSSPRAVQLTYTPHGWDSPISVLGTHPVAPTDRERAGLRDAQLEFAGEWAADQSGAFFVVGDFNATPWSAPFRQLMGAAELNNSQSGFGLQPTFSTESFTLLRVPIDHLVHSPALEVTDRQLGPSLASDHFPLIVTLQPTP